MRVVVTLLGFLGGLLLLMLGAPIAEADRSYAPNATNTPTRTRTPTPINVGNFVWDDIDKDGRQDAGEPGLAGVTMQLWNGAKNDLIAQTTTNANGNYTLIAPTPGQYRVRVILPNFQDTLSPKDQAGGEDTLDSDFNPSGTDFGFTDVYTFASNLISITSIDAGIVKYRTPTPTRTPTPINIGNFVWHDLDGDGIQDASEPGIAGVTVQLWNEAKTALIDTTTTNANGGYTVVAPIPGAYRVRVILPLAGDTFSPLDIGSDDTKDSDINSSGANYGFTNAINIASNVISITSIDAGIRRTPSNTNTPTATRTRTPTPTATKVATMTPIPTATSSCTIKPPKPALVAPTHQAMVTQRRVPLDWNNASCATKYRVVVRQNAPNGPLADREKVTVSAYTTVRLAKGKTYFWRVSACNPPYGCRRSEWRQFFTTP